MHTFLIEWISDLHISVDCSIVSNICVRARCWCPTREERGDEKYVVSITWELFSAKKVKKVTLFVVDCVLLHTIILWPNVSRPRKKNLMFSAICWSSIIHIELFMNCRQHFVEERWLRVVVRFEKWTGLGNRVSVLSIQYSSMRIKINENNCSTRIKFC